MADEGEIDNPTPAYSELIFFARNLLIEINSIKCCLFRSLSQNNNRCGISQNEPTPAIEVVVMYDFVETHKGI